MSENQSVLKKLQLKDESVPMLIINMPEQLVELKSELPSDLHTGIHEDTEYGFVLVFGTSNAALREAGKAAAGAVADDGLLWLCYPKKTSKLYKGSDCSRDTVAGLLAEEGFEPVRQIAIDEDWSALRFRPVEQIKTMTRKFAVTAKGQERTGRSAAEAAEKTEQS
ncbi:DUF3052 domain-containing protein [Paenibacillus turpanensis]|uniref:DUF3052 domain-containing protein n=1 Tax=Paenibacillus turpanensis TaxID=2689078 RepID=UPI00140C6AF3|nr:DUF3052 domain-containing protein [Paenibacillus turpanensis]